VNTNEALRVVGHLLEHHGSQLEQWASDKDGNSVDIFSRSACEWCLDGAVELVEQVFEIGSDLDQAAVKCLRLRDDTTGSLIRVWDGAGPRKRQRIIDRLKNAGLEGA
jgi:hypothetical protein